MSNDVLSSLAAIPAAPVRYLWDPYLAAGRLTLLDGDPGTGKSFLAIDLAARLSRGGPMPDGSRLNRPCTTLYFTTEDDAADTIRPRAEAAGADLDRILVETPGRFEPLLRFPQDINPLWRYIRDYHVDFVVFDPLAAFLQEGISANLDSSMRRVLTPLAYVAAKSGAAMKLVRHNNKYGNGKALYRGLGSIGITAASRSELLLATHPDDPTLRVLAHTKTNGALGPSLGFRIQPDETGRHRLVWTGPVDLSANELCAGREPAAKRPRERAGEWLKQELANGPRKASDLIAAAAKKGIAERTLDRARKDFRIVSYKPPGARMSDGWVWYDPSIEIDQQSLSQLDVLPDLGLEGCESVDEMLNRLRDQK